MRIQPAQWTHSITTGAHGHAPYAPPGGSMRYPAGLPAGKGVDAVPPKGESGSFLEKLRLPAAAQMTSGIRGLVLGLVFGLVLLMAAVLAPSAFGFQPMVVMSGSMAPTLHTGDIAVVRAVDAEGLQLADVVTYRANDRTITHRIAGIQVTRGGMSFLLQGDANPAMDPQPVGPEQIVGKVVYRIPRLGSLVFFANSPAGRAALLLLPGLALLALVARGFWPRRRASGDTVRA